jgi:iron complex transport system permease protein
MVCRDVGKGGWHTVRMLKARALFVVLAMALATVGAGVVLGPRGAIASIVPRDPMEARIVRDIRLPRVSLAFIAGAALATAGMAFQALFRNALATPYTLGVSAGASLGAAIYVYAGTATTFAGIPGETFAALAGAALSTLLVYVLARAATGFSSATL